MTILTRILDHRWTYAEVRRWEIFKEWGGCFVRWALLFLGAWLLFQIVKGAVEFTGYR